MPSKGVFIFVNYEKSSDDCLCLGVWLLDGYKLGELNSPFPPTCFSRLLELCSFGRFILGFGDTKKVGFVNCVSDFLSPDVV